MIPAGSLYSCQAPLEWAFVRGRGQLGRGSPGRVCLDFSCEKDHELDPGV